MELIGKYLYNLFRDFKRNFSHWLLVSLCLTLGALCLTVSLNYFFYENSYEHFYKGYADIYRLVMHEYRNKELFNKLAIVPFPHGPKLKDEVPEIKAYTRFRVPRGIAGEFQVKYDENSFQEDGIFFADKGFLEMFSFKLLKGDPNSLDKINSVILTASTAKKYFGNQEPIGKKIYITNKWGELFCMVTGVLADPPPNTHLQFSMLVSVDTYLSIDGKRFVNNWGDHSWYVYFRLAPGTDPVKLEERYRQIIYSNQPGFLRESYDLRYPLQKMTDVQFCNDYKWDLPYKSNRKVVNYLFLTGLLIFLMGFINYLNLSVIKLNNRQKELFVRKLAGSGFKQTFRLFFTENLIFITIVLTFSLLLSYILLFPFNQIIGRSIPVYLYKIPVFWVYVIGLIVIISVISSLYGYFMYSMIQKKSTNRYKILSIRNMFIIFQICFTLLFIVSTIVFYRQFQFITKQPLGFDLNNVLVIRNPILVDNQANNNKLLAFVGELRRNRQVDKVSLSNEIPGKMIEFSEASYFVDYPVNKQIIYRLYVNNQFLELYGIPFISGEHFREYTDSVSNKVIINEKALSTLAPGLSVENALGRIIDTRGIKYRVIGVVKNHHQQYQKEEIMPIIYEYSTRKHIDYISVKLLSDNKAECIREIHELYNRYYRGTEFNCFFNDEFYKNQYRVEMRLGIACSIFSIIALMLISLGILGTIRNEILKKFREIGIRKSLGCSHLRLYMLLTKTLVIQVIAAFIISGPCIYYILSEWLNNFAYRIHINAWDFLTSLLIVFLTVILSVSYYIIYAIKQNPANILRYEE